MTAQRPPSLRRRHSLPRRTRARRADLAEARQQLSSIRAAARASQSDRDQARRRDGPRRRSKSRRITLPCSGQQREARGPRQLKTTLTKADAIFVHDHSRAVRRRHRQPRHPEGDYVRNQTASSSLVRSTRLST
jgi:hypothetical protein